MTFGEKIVGKTFNPSGDDKVARIKQLAAEMADICFEEYKKTNASRERDIVADKAFQDIMQASSSAVRLVTFKF
jgi:hypothetical protein